MEYIWNTQESCGIIYTIIYIIYINLWSNHMESSTMVIYSDAVRDKCRLCVWINDIRWQLQFGLRILQLHPTPANLRTGHQSMLPFLELPADSADSWNSWWCFHDVFDDFWWALFSRDSQNVPSLCWKTLQCPWFWTLPSHPSQPQRFRTRKASNSTCLEVAFTLFTHVYTCLHVDCNLNNLNNLSFLNILWKKPSVAFIDFSFCSGEAADPSHQETLTSPSTKRKNCVPRSPCSKTNSSSSRAQRQGSRRHVKAKGVHGLENRRCRIMHNRVPCKFKCRFHKVSHTLVTSWNMLRLWDTETRSWTSHFLVFQRCWTSLLDLDLGMGDLRPCWKSSRGTQQPIPSFPTPVIVAKESENPRENTPKWYHLVMTNIAMENHHY